MGVEGIILSTDDYFMQRGQYVYNRNDLGTAHEWNQKRGEFLLNTFSGAVEKKNIVLH